MILVLAKALLATAAATASALCLFLLSRMWFQAPYDALNIAEAIAIPILVGFPITSYIFYQNNRLLLTQSALTKQANDNERQKTLINELNHRVKNTLATVQAIGTQTARSSGDLDAFLDAFNKRIGAMAGAHDLLSRNKWDPVSLADLASQVLRPFGDSLIATGSPVMLRPAAALSLTLVLHELATNASKYGALLTGGRVILRWRVDQQFRLDWVEDGGPPLVELPSRTGFGSRLINQVIVHELDGTYDSKFTSSGYMVHIQVPLANIN